MYYGYGYGYGFDVTYLLVLIGMIICMAAQAKMTSTFRRYAQVGSHNGMTGRDAAVRILQSQGLYDVQVQHVSGTLTDHYDPRSKIVSLSDATYGSTSVAAIGVAAHECGHALQHARGYAPLSIRTALVPVANLGSTVAWPLILIGFIFNSNMSYLLIEIGIIAFSLAVLFQIVTLPVEFDASKRALNLLGNTGMLYEQEVSDVRKVLTAAALTYVASAAASILQLLRIMMLANRRRR